MRAVVNAHVNPDAVTRPSGEARAFHASLAGYATTPLRALPAVAVELGLGAVAVKDESARLGLPAFKVLGASWAVEHALRDRPDVDTLIAASAGNHGRAVARVAALRGLRARIFLPGRSAPGRRDAIAGEGAEVVVIDGDYEEAVARAADDGAQPGAIEIADVGESAPARWVIDGYATLFAELAEQAAFDVVLVPIGVGSLGAAAARFGAATGTRIVGVEPATAACLTASLDAGAPTTVAAPGTTMAGMDCAEVSPAAWPDLRAGIHCTVTVTDDEAHAAMRELAAAGLAIGDCGAAPLAALRALLTDPACAPLATAVGLDADARVALIATEGPTDPAGYARALAAGGDAPQR
jgi:diaminopropionate ammonia-lyase